MNIIFMGTPAFALPTLKALLKTDHKIQAVITVPDKPKGRGLKISESEVKIFAAGSNIRVLQPEKLRDPDLISEIKSLSPDLIIVVAFRVLPKEIFSIPKFGSFNLHASLLPRYRGAAPINHAIMNGDTITGVTTFFLKDIVDTGNIILQKECNITAEDDAGTLSEKLSEIGAVTVLETIKLIEESGTNVPVRSQDESIASPAPKIFKNDCKIDWLKPAVKIVDFVRGLAPYPGAYTTLSSKQMKIFKAKNHGSFLGLPPGKIKINERRFFAGTADGLIEILELQPEGKKRISVKDYLNGNPKIDGSDFDN